MAPPDGVRGPRAKVRVSRVTKRPRTRAVKGERVAQQLLHRLSQPEWRQRMQFTERQVRMMERIADGRPPRNANAMVAIYRLKADHAYEKPRLGIDITVKSHAELVAEAAGLLPVEAEGGNGAKGKERPA